MSDEPPLSPEEAFVKDIRELIYEWYNGCPRSIQFVTKVIKSYRTHFKDDKI